MITTWLRATLAGVLAVAALAVPAMYVDKAGGPSPVTVGVDTVSHTAPATVTPPVTEPVTEPADMPAPVTEPVTEPAPEPERAPAPAPAVTPVATPVPVPVTEPTRTPVPVKAQVTLPNGNVCHEDQPCWNPCTMGVNGNYPETDPNHWIPGPCDLFSRLPYDRWFAIEITPQASPPGVVCTDGWEYTQVRVWVRESDGTDMPGTTVSDAACANDQDTVITTVAAPLFRQAATLPAVNVAPPGQTAGTDPLA